MHLKFVNAIASYAQALNLPKDHEHSAYRFHSDMFQSGIERILSVRRLDFRVHSCADTVRYLFV